MMRSISQISRREFLKLATVSLTGMLVWPHNTLYSQAASYQGRIIDPEVTLYEKPSYKSSPTKQFWKDTVVPITAVTIGDEEPAHNRVWYQIGGDGFAHSGVVQPVLIQLNQAVASLPTAGALAEVTVPYTDAHWYPDKEKPVAYRFYYQTTHWINKIVFDQQGDSWYQVFEDRWENLMYVPTAHMRLIPDEELTPISPEVPQKNKRLEVNTEGQFVTAIEFDRAVFVARIASGARFSNGNFSTPLGEHYVFHKRPFRHMAAGNLAANGFDLPGVPWVSYFTERGVAFHGTYWHNDYGRPRSHGCINLTPAAAKWIYRWTNPVVPPDQQRVVKSFGTIVNVR